MKNEKNSISKSLEKFQKFLDREEKSHFEDFGKEERCIHQEHNPPNHLLIPQGKIYVHICPECKNKIIIQPIQISY